MMAAREKRSVSRPSRWLAAVGSFLGLAMALVLTVLLIRVSIIERTGGSPAFGLIYSAMLLTPFVLSITALFKGSVHSQATVWGLAGSAASLLAVFSVSLVALPLLIPAVL
ncbi:MAG TPA: hypothetical protein VHI97_03180, partial [Actinomycetota bacterium]|nr:hypothetical protein [Actinomycetota bacterium]